MGRLILTHISGRFSNLDNFLEEARKTFPRIQVAEDLMVIEVPYPD